MLIEMKISRTYKYILAGMFCFAFAGVNAQTQLGSYFLEQSPYRHQLNPALMPNRGYLAIPALGNIEFNVNSPLSYKSFIYPATEENGKLNTFLSPEVDAEDFEKKIKDTNPVMFNIDLSILSFGFFRWNGYNTFDISLRSQTSLVLPGDLFRFLKNGNPVDGDTYDLHNTAVRNNTYVELALGHAHKINDQWTVGAKLKGLVGGANIDARYKRFDVKMTEQEWRINAEGVAELSVAGVALKHDEKNRIDGIDFDSGQLGIAGGGAGIDLGATYEPIENLVVSAALTNVGFIVWNKNHKGAASPEDDVVFNGFHGIGNDDYEGGTVDDQVDDKLDELENIYLFKEVDAPKRTTWLSPTLLVGGEYQLLKNRISAGLVYSTTFYPGRAHTRLMASLNLKPLRMIMVGINGSVSNYANTFGAVINLGPLFVGAEISSLKVNPDFIPLGKLAANVNFGLSVPLGKKPKEKK